VKLPSKLAISLGTLYAAVVAISFEVSAPHWTHVVIGAAGTLLAAFSIHPQEGAHAAEPLLPPPPSSVLEQPAPTVAAAAVALPSHAPAPGESQAEWDARMAAGPVERQPV
jgi:hypothetical protein